MPRPVLAEKSYLGSRRCTQRQFLLTPSKLVNEIMLYCLAVAAERFEIDVHAVCVMSNHWHPVVTDRKGRYPEFLGWVHKTISKCINASMGRWENLWATEQPSMRELDGCDDLVGAMVYALTNPVKDGLVVMVRQWPGVLLGPEAWGKEITAQRPKVYFSEEGSMPEQATLRLVRPSIRPDLSDAALVSHVQQAVHDEECRIRREFRLKGRRFLGRAAVLAQCPTSTPKSRAPRRHRAVRPPRHTVGRALKEFVESYRYAIAKWKDGMRATLFPPGTYMLRIHAGVTCAPT